MSTAPELFHLHHYLAEPDFQPYSENSVSHLTPSSFWLVLRDARVASGRDPRSGERVTMQPATMWLGAVGYLILLDQIGSALRRPSRPSTGHPIIRALAMFSDVLPNDRRVLYALRCALAHDYSLVNVGSAGDHLFRLEWDEMLPLVRMPPSPWTGEYSELQGVPDRRPGDTMVNLLALTEVSESVVQTVFKAHAENDLVMAVTGTEAAHRYFVTITEGMDQ